MGQAATETAAPRKGRPRRSESVALHRQIVKCTQDGTYPSHREIADRVGCSKTTVVEVLAKYGINHAETELFKENRADVYAGIIGKIVKSIDDDTIKNASLRDRATAAGIFQDKERLERGQSTTNVASLHSIAERAIKAVSVDATRNPLSADPVTIDAE